MPFREFLRDTRGQIAIIFGLLLIPLVAFIGVAVDYQRSENVRTRLQQSLDVVGLRLARDGESLSDGQLEARAASALAALFPEGGDYAIAVETAAHGDGRLEIAATGRVPTTFANVVGIGTIDISARSTIAWGTGRLELALVLDNTGSMQGAKLASLKEAVGQLLDTLEADVDDPELLKIAVIPFNTQVRISTANANAPWLIPLSASSGNSGTNWLLCQWFPALCAPPPWYGCVTDRTQPNDVTDIGYEPLQRTATGYPAATCAASNGFAQVLPLTSDLDTVRARVEAMTAAGNTNVTIGVAWGMAALSQRAPLTESLPPDETDLRRIMVVLTDGENTENRWTQNTRSIDDRTRLACDSAKASGMLVFTIRVLEGNQDLLEDCASERAYYFNVTDVDDLLPAFEGIARTISRLRVAE